MLIMDLLLCNNRYWRVSLVAPHRLHQIILILIIIIKHLTLVYHMLSNSNSPTINSHLQRNTVTTTNLHRLLLCILILLIHFVLLTIDYILQHHVIIHLNLIFCLHLPLSSPQRPSRLEAMQARISNQEKEAMLPSCKKRTSCLTTRWWKPWRQRYSEAVARRSPRRLLARLFDHMETRDSAPCRNLIQHQRCHQFWHILLSTITTRRLPPHRLLALQSLSFRL